MFKDKLQNFIGEFCEDEKHRLPNFIPVGIGIGISFYFSLDSEPNFLLNVVVLLLILCFHFLVKSNRWIFYILLSISFGFFVSQLRTKTIGTFMLSQKKDEPISLTATVETCEKTEKGLTFIVDEVRNRKYPKLNKLHLTWRGKKATISEEDYVPGSRVLFRVILSPLHPQAFPGAYDFKKQQYFKGVSARGFIIAPPKILRKPERPTFHLFIKQLRHSIDKKIEKYLPKNTASVAKALITGNKSEVSQNVRSNFANSGTAHLLAISGLHMGIIGFFIFWFFRVFLCCIPCIYLFFDIKKIAAIISWIGVLFYLYISGNSVPSLRAFVMHTLIICAILVERCALTMRSVAIAATLIMSFSPEVILFPSFQMSFAAVIAIVAFFEYAWDFSGFFKTLINIMATTVVASIPTAIFSMHSFNQLTLNSIPANLVSVPLMSFFIMPLAVVALFLMPFGLAHPMVSLMGYGVDLLIKISELSAKLPGSHFVMHTPTSTNMAIFIFSGLILTLIHHRIRFLGIVGSIIGGVCYYLTPTPDIFISQKSKVIGIKTEENACFNHLGYFKSVTSSWARSVGFEKREKFNSKGCRKYIREISKGTYAARIKNQDIIITDNKSRDLQPSNTILLDENSNFARTIYTQPLECASNEQKSRPWTE
ncbi:MAG: ComEC family competence protein [Holosporaceae bacterium]|jgi:competence protein ComEC|nr:ComEC family competence protein [Holosporaceae bacterium]